MTEPILFCKNCKHHSVITRTNDAQPSHVCNRAINPVDGSTLQLQAFGVRNDPSMCGLGAAWYEQRDSRVLRFPGART